MAKTIGEKMLGAELPESLVDKFMAQSEEVNCKKKVALRGAVKLWVNLPLEVRSKLLNQGINDDSFVALVEDIVKDVIAGQDVVRDAVRAELNAKKQAKTSSKRRKSKSKE